MIFEVNLIQQMFEKAQAGDSRAQNTILEWSLMILSPEVNNSASDITSRTNLKEYAEAGYSLNVALQILVRNHKKDMREHLKSIVLSVDETLWKVSIPLVMDITIAPARLVSVLYNDLFGVIARLYKDE